MDYWSGWVSFLKASQFDFRRSKCTIGAIMNMINEIMQDLENNVWLYELIQSIWLCLFWNPLQEIYKTWYMRSCTRTILFLFNREASSCLKSIFKCVCPSTSNMYVDDTSSKKYNAMNKTQHWLKKELKLKFT